MTSAPAQPAQPGDDRARNRSTGPVNPGPPPRRQPGVSTSPALAPRPVVDLDRFMVEDYPGVVAAVRLIAGDRAAAEDAVQDALVRLLQSPPSEPLRSPAAWVTVVASNTARSAHRRSGSEQRALERVAHRTPDGTAADVDTVGQEVSHRRTVLDAVAALPLGQRQVCVMHYYLDASVAEIASGLGVTDGTVKTQLHRARASLAAALGQTFEEVEPRG